MLEIGCPLQNGTLAAREYGIPSVSGVDGAVDLLEDGQPLGLDGSIGIVRILEDA